MLRVIAIDPSINNIGVAKVEYIEPNQFDYRVKTIRTHKLLKKNSTHFVDIKGKPVQHAIKFMILEKELRKEKLYLSDFILIEQPPFFVKKSFRGNNLNTRSVNLLWGAFSITLVVAKRVVWEMKSGAQVIIVPAGHYATKEKGKLWLESVGVETVNLNEHEIDALVMALSFAETYTTNKMFKLLFD